MFLHSLGSSRFQGFRKDAQPTLDIGLGNDERGEEADDVAMDAALYHQKPTLPGLIDDPLTTILIWPLAVGPRTPSPSPIS